MGAKTKKTRHAGKFRTGFGVRARQNYNKIEDMQKSIKYKLNKKGYVTPTK